MAFTVSNQQTTVFGNLRATYGDWAGAAADATGSIVVAGGRVWMAYIAGQDASGTYTASVNTPVSVSTSGSATTVTVYNLDGVTTGRFFIIHS